MPYPLAIWLRLFSVLPGVFKIGVDIFYWCLFSDGIAGSEDEWAVFSSDGTGLSDSFSYVFGGSVLYDVDEVGVSHEGHFVAAYFFGFFEVEISYGRRGACFEYVDARFEEHL